MNEKWNVQMTDSTDDALWKAHGKVFVLGETERFEEELMKSFVTQGAALLVVFDGDQMVGRCLVGCHKGEEIGVYFAGFFASISDGSIRKKSYEMLLEAAKKYMCQEQGRALIAPLNGNSWFPYRLRVDDHAAQFPWEPKRDLELKEALDGCNFKEHLKYWSIGSRGLDQVLSHCAPYYHAALKHKFRFVPFNFYAGEKSAELLRGIWQISHTAFAKSPLFASISFEDFRRFYARGFDAVPRDLGRMLVAPDGSLAGFIWNFFAAGHSTMVFKSMAIDPRFQGQHLGDAILYEPVREALARGAKDYISALVYRGNRSEFISRLGQTTWEHHYGTWVWYS